MDELHEGTGFGEFVTAPRTAAPSWPRPGHAACSPQRQPLHRVDTGLPRQDAGRGCLMFFRGQRAARQQSSGFPSKNTPGKQLFLFSRMPKADSCLRLQHLRDSTCVTVRQGLGTAPGATRPLTGRTEEKATGWVDGLHGREASGPEAWDRSSQAARGSRRRTRAWRRGLVLSKRLPCAHTATPVSVGSAKLAVERLFLRVRGAPASTYEFQEENKTHYGCKRDLEMKR